MAYTLQLRDAQSSLSLKSISGVGSNSPEFIALINEAQRRLTRRGNWFGMTQVGVFVFQGNLITWPRYVGTVVQARTSKGLEVKPFNQWYSFTGSFDGNEDDWTCNLILEDAGMTCTYNEIVGGGLGQLIRLYVEKTEDIGKTVTIYGKAYGNQTLMHQDSAGVWQQGLVLTAATPYTSTSLSITKIESIVKDAMSGVSRLFQYDVTTDFLGDIAMFEPNETRPTYRCSRIHGLPPCCNTQDDTVPKFQQIEALVKLRFIPAENPFDFLLVDNFDALKLAVQAIKAEQASDNKQAEEFWIKSIRELNFEERDARDDGTIPISLDATMAQTLRNPQ